MVSSNAPVRNLLPLAAERWDGGSSRLWRRDGMLCPFFPPGLTPLGRISRPRRRIDTVHMSRTISLGLFLIASVPVRVTSAQQAPSLPDTTRAYVSVSAPVVALTHAMVLD